MRSRSTQPSPNAIAHFDIAGPDLGALRGFYSDLFGWEIVSRGPGYASIATPEGSPNGAIVEAQDGSLTIGIVVAELERSLERTVANGGSVAMPATDNGWITKAQIVDPAGNRVTLIQG